MSQDVNRLRTVLQDHSGHNVLCFICHTKESLCDNGTGSVQFVLCFICHAKESLCGNGTGSMGGWHVDSADGLGSGGST